MKISPTQSDFLNLSRWVAAWLVVAEHARSLVFLDYSDLDSPGLLAKGFYFLTGFGHEAVMVFFVISGYLVGGKVWSLYREGRFGWRRYMADRLSRLYAVLIAALLLGLLLDWSGYLFFNSYGLYNKGYEGSIAVLGTAPIERMGLRDFFVNTLFLQTIAGPSFGSNGPLWSLAYEWWYYVLFPAIGAILLLRSLMGVMAGGALTLLLLFVLPADVMWLFGIWMLGVIAAALPLERKTITLKSEILKKGSEGDCVPKSFDGEGSGMDWGVAPEDRRSATDEGGGAKHGSCSAMGLGGVLLMVMAFLFFVGALLLARVEVLKVPYAWQYLLGVAYALLIVSLAGCQWRLPGFRPSAYLSDFSYSAYLIHFPAIMFFLSVGYEVSRFGIRMPFEVVGLFWYFGIFFVALLSSWLVSLYTERKTANLRRLFYSLLHVH